MNIGVLALQGDFLHHQKRLQEIGVESSLVKKPENLEKCSGLIIPGGESTTLVKLLKNIGLFEAIPEFAKHRPIFGTCAGAILLSRKVANHLVTPLGIIDMTIERNAYGRQLDSFIDDIQIQAYGEARTVEAIFIRAPKIRNIGKEIKALAYHRDDIVFAESQNALAATFHPELTDDPFVHQYFIDKIRRHL